MKKPIQLTVVLYFFAFCFQSCRNTDEALFLQEPELTIENVKVLDEEHLQ